MIREKILSRAGQLDGLQASGSPEARAEAVAGLKPLPVLCSATRPPLANGWQSPCFQSLCTAGSVARSELTGSLQPQFHFRVSRRLTMYSQGLTLVVLGPVWSAFENILRLYLKRYFGNDFKGCELPYC